MKLLSKYDIISFLLSIYFFCAVFKNCLTKLKVEAIFEEIILYYVPVNGGIGLIERYNG